MFDAVLADFGSTLLGLAPSLPQLAAPALGSMDTLFAHAAFAQTYLNNFIVSAAPAQLYTTLASATPT